MMDTARPPSQSVSRALELARAGQQDSIAALAAAVRIPSLTGEEAAIQRHLAALARAEGAEVELAEPDLPAMFAAFPGIAQYPTHWQHDLILPYTDLPTLAALRDSGLEAVLNYRERPNLVARWPGTGGGRSLILNGHVDTVTIEPRADWSRDPFGAEIAAGRLYGRGACDMKGGLLAGLMALACLHRAGVRLRGDVALHCVVNEEHSGNGTLDLVCRGHRADAALVLEPTGNRIFHSHTGGLYWQVALEGVSRSPGARWEGTELAGQGAIDALPPVIEALLALEARINAAAPPGGPMPFALTIGRVSGGHYETATAAEALLKGGAYFAPQVGSVAAVMDAFREAIEAANRADPRLRRHPARLEFLHHDDATDQPADLDVAQVLGAALAAAGGVAQALPGSFCCDLRHLVNQGGMPGVIFGPGSIAQAHKPDEFIPVAEYLQAIEVLIAFIADWCGVEA